MSTLDGREPVVPASGSEVGSIGASSTVDRLLAHEPYHAATLPGIKAKLVKRYFAPRFTMTGRVAWKSYATAFGAAKALATAQLWDDVLGVRKWVSDGHSEGEYYLWRGKVDKEIFAKLMFDYGFRCEPHIGWGGYPERCCPETYGFCGVKYKQEIARRARLILAGSSAPSPEPATAEKKGISINDPALSEHAKAIENSKSWPSGPKRRRTAEKKEGN